MFLSIRLDKFRREIRLSSWHRPWSTFSSLPELGLGRDLGVMNICTYLKILTQDSTCLYTFDINIILSSYIVHWYTLYKVVCHQFPPKQNCSSAGAVRFGSHPCSHFEMNCIPMPFAGTFQSQILHAFATSQRLRWNRICRPGSILGPQQQFLCDMQQDMWQAKGKCRDAEIEIFATFCD